MRSRIFSDIDGTIIHPDCDAGCLKIDSEYRYVAQITIDLIKKIRERRNNFTFITGRRLAGFLRVAQLIPYDNAVVEGGGLILDGNTYDEKWVTKQKPIVGIFGKYSGPLWDFERKVQSLGYKTNHDGKLTSFRLFIDDPENLTESQRLGIEQQVNPMAGAFGVMTVRNMHYLDVMPQLSGKENAIAYLLEKNKFARTYTLGDDFNDLIMLQKFGTPLCPANAIETVRKLVRERNGYVAPSSSHRGTIQMLEYILI